MWIHRLKKGGHAIDLNTAQGRAFVAILQVGCDMFRDTLKENTRRALEWRRKTAWPSAKPGSARGSSFAAARAASSPARSSTSTRAT